MLVTIMSLLLKMCVFLPGSRTLGRPSKGNLAQGSPRDQRMAQGSPSTQRMAQGSPRMASDANIPKPLPRTIHSFQKTQVSSKKKYKYYSLNALSGISVYKFLEMQALSLYFINTRK